MAPKEVTQHLVGLTFVPQGWYSTLRRSGDTSAITCYHHHHTHLDFCFPHGAEKGKNKITKRQLSREKNRKKLGSCVLHGISPSLLYSGALAPTLVSRQNRPETGNQHCLQPDPTLPLPSVESWAPILQSLSKVKWSLRPWVNGELL